MSVVTAEAFAPLANITEPKWWTGTPAISPERFVIDGNQYRVNGEPLVASPELAAHMQKTFDDVGLVHVINTGLDNLQAMRLIATQVLENERQYEGGANPRKTIEKMSTRWVRHCKPGCIIIMRWPILDPAPRW